MAKLESLRLRLDGEYLAWAVMKDVLEEIAQGQVPDWEAPERAAAALVAVAELTGEGEEDDGS